MIYDISPPLSERTAVWPGDTPLSRKKILQLADGESVELSTLQATVHLGAHADAPAHYHKGGASIGEIDLAPYWGPCQLITVAGVDLIRPQHFQNRLAPDTERVLFRTLSVPDPEVFNTDFSSFSSEAISELGKRGIKLIGIDTPSVDPFDSKDLPAHHELLRQGVRNLEGLRLDQIPDGSYELVALPLALQGFDASPVRAALKPMQ